MTPVGIIGGGQLARLLALKAHQLGLNPWVISSSRTDPAAQVTSNWLKSNLSDASDFLRFLSETDLVTFESEFVDYQVLKQSLDQCSQKPLIFPAVELIERLSDRRFQKKMFDDHNLPTAPWSSDPYELSLPLVAKQRRFGYDGKGTFFCKTRADIAGLKERSDLNSWIFESEIHFQRELAVSIARNAQNEFAVLPLVESFQEQAICLHTHGPVEHPSFQKLLVELKDFLSAIDYVGIIAFELFDTGQNLLINELAPRVHNSAHYSIEALSHDQFELHWLSGLNARLASPQLRAHGFAMYNLLGESPTPARCQLKPNTSHSLHWYAKNESRPGRKLGHITAMAKTPEEALTQLKKIRSDYHV